MVAGREQVFGTHFTDAPYRRLLARLEDRDSQCDDGNYRKSLVGGSSAESDALVARWSSRGVRKSVATQHYQRAAALRHGFEPRDSRRTVTKSDGRDHGMG